MKENTGVIEFLSTHAGKIAFMQWAGFGIAMCIIFIVGNAILDNKKFTIVDALAHSFIATFATVMSILILLSFHLLTWVLIIPPFVAILTRPLWIYAMKHKGAIFGVILWRLKGIWIAATTKYTKP